MTRPAALPVLIPVDTPVTDVVMIIVREILHKTILVAKPEKPNVVLNAFIAKIVPLAVPPIPGIG